MALSVWPLIMTKAQEETAIEFQGRVQSSFGSLSGVMMIIVFLMVNLISRYVSIAHLYWIEILFVGISLCFLLHYIKKKATD